MSERTGLALYRLALALVEDEDAAGDIFMDARNEADLLRRAAAWRRERGLAAVEVPEALVTLSEEQELHGLHLARRGGLRRRIRWVGGASLCAAMLFGLWQLGGWLPGGLAREAVFAGAPAASTDRADGTRFSIYRAEVTTSGVTLWWELRGSGAADLSAQFAPEMRLGRSGRWRAPEEQRVTRSRGDRVLGRSDYRAVIGAAGEAQFRAAGAVAAGAAPDGEVKAELERSPELKGGLEVRIDQELTAGPALIQIDSITLQPDGTLLRFRTTAGEGMGPPYPVLMRVGNRTYSSRRPAESLNGPGSHEAWFPPLPNPEDGLTLFFSGPYEELPELSYDLPDLSVLQELLRKGSNYQLALHLPDDVQLTELPLLTDGAGRSFKPVQVRVEPVRGGSGFRYILAGDNLPPDAALASLHLPGVVRVHPGAMINLDLERSLP